MSSYRVQPRRSRGPVVFIVVLVVLAALMLFGLLSCVFGLGGDSSESDGVDARSVDQIVYDAVAPGEELLAYVGSALPDIDYTSNIEVFYQYPDYPSGCEIAALTCVLNSMGYDVTLAELIEGDYLTYDPNWSGVDSGAYVGTPYGQGGAFPPAIVLAANRYLEEQGASERAEEVDDLTFDELISLVEAGYPVMVWVTVGYGSPTFSGRIIDGYAWYTNEHCVVLYGYDGNVETSSESGSEIAGEVYISDSIDGYVSLSAQDFYDLYVACGALSVVIYDEADGLVLVDNQESVA